MAHAATQIKSSDLASSRMRSGLRVSGMRQAGYADSPAEDQIDAPAALQPHTSSRPHSSAQACQQSGSNSFPPDPGVAAPDEQAAEATALQQQAACRHDPAASGIQSAMGHQPGAARPAAQEPGGSQQLPAVLETDPQRWSVSGILGHRAKLLAQLPVHSPDYEVQLAIHPMVVTMPTSRDAAEYMATKSCMKWWPFRHRQLQQAAGVLTDARRISITHACLVGFASGGCALDQYTAAWQFYGPACLSIYLTSPCAGVLG